MKFRRLTPALLLLPVLAAALVSHAATSTSTVKESHPVNADDWTVSRPNLDPLQKIAQAYGLQSVYQVEALTFVYQEKKSKARVRREWTWDIADNRVEYHGRGPTGLPIEHVYRRDKLDDGDAALNRKIDEWFVVDQYMLLFPFHLAWEKRLKVERKESARTSILPGESPMISVTYPSGTSAAGDRYDVFYGPQNLIKEWSYYPAGQHSAAFTTTWDRHARAGPLVFSLVRRSANGAQAVWFDRVSVRLSGRGWVEAVPIEPAVSRGKAEKNARGERL